MKKIISILLLLTMCIGCFAGCAPEAKEDANLNAAAEYLYAMYKDAKATTNADYTVVSQVRINDVTYPIEWTSDKADNVKVEAGENGMAVVKITASTEEINYKLTATLKNAEGATVSVSFDKVIPAKPADPTIPTGTIVLAYPKDNQFVSVTPDVYTSSSGSTKNQMDMTENEAEAVALKVVQNSDGTITFVSGEYYLYADGTHATFVKEQGDNTKFVLEATDGGYFIKCAIANYNGKAQYLEVYSGNLCSYGMGTDPSIYVFKLQETTVATGTPNMGGSSSGSTDSGNTGNTGNSGNTGNTGNTGNSGNSGNSGTTIPSGGKVVLSFPKDSKYVTGTHSEYTSSSGKTKMQLELTDSKAQAIALEKVTNSDGTISFKAGGKYLYADGTHVKFVSSRDDNTKFVLETANGGYYVKCAVANYNGNPQYLEVYSGKLTCYGMGADPSIYVFKLEDGTGANGTIKEATSSGSSSSGSSSSGSSSSGSSSSGSSSSGSSSTTVNGKLAASIDMIGINTRTSYSTEQTVHKANGITYTNDKASNTNGNIDMANNPNYGARAYKGSTVKIEYTGMVAIVFHLDDFNNCQYTAGFDGMEISGATITRNGGTVTITFASATNVFQSAELASQVRIKSIDVYTAK